MRSAHILIVDDEPNIRLMLRLSLASEEYTLEEAADGRAALDAILRRVPDVMILDLSMPQLDGMAVLERLTAMRADRKPNVVVLTAFGSIPTAVKAIRLGAVDFLEKPVVPDEVRESVLGALAEKTRSQQPGIWDDPLAGGYTGVLDRVRKSLRLAKYDDAQTLLMKAADLAHKDAAYFNLLGVLYELQRQLPLARKFYGKAIRTDRYYVPAQQNMRRIYELNVFGESQQPVALGDELDGSGDLA